MTDTLVEKIASVRRADSRADATAEANSAKLTERQRRERIRERNRALWIDFFMGQAEAFTLRSAEYQRRARALEQRFIERGPDA